MLCAGLVTHNATRKKKLIGENGLQMSLDLKVCDPQKNKLLEETSSSTAGTESDELKQLSQGAAHMVAALGD